MAAELKVGVGADVKDLEKGLKQGEQSVKQFAESSEKSLALTDKSVKSFSKTAITESTKTGVAFQGLSRVMSDAAFGPGAIANNLAGLGDDFKQLSLQAKESGQSIGKTLIQSLTGAGGLNLALGGLTLGMSLASFGLSAWTRMFPDADKKVKDTSDSIKEYIATLGDLTKASLTGAQNSQEELAHLKVLFAAYQNANLPLEARKAAYKEIQDKYPAYFANIRFEAEATGKTTKAYEALTLAIIATGRARAAEALIAEKSKKKLENEQRILDIEKDRIGLIKDAAVVKNRLDKMEVGASEAAAVRAQNLANTQIEATNKVAESIARTNKLKAENIKLDEEILRLTNFASNNFKEDPGKDIPDPTFKAINPLSTAKSLTAGALTLPVITAPAIDFGPMKESIAVMSQSMLDFTASMTNIVNNGLVNAFNGLGEAIGNALATGSNMIEAIGASLLSSIGDTLVQFGKLTIAAGVAAMGLSMALTNPTPAGAAAAIAAGVALVAVGSAVKAFSNNVASKGVGGAGGQGFGSPSAPGSGFQPNAVQYPGGQQSNVFIPSMTLKGQDIVIAYDRTKGLNGRMGGK